MRRVAIEDDDAGGYVSPGLELVPEDFGGHLDDDHEQEEDWRVEREVNALLGRGWPAGAIADHLGISEARVHDLDTNPERDYIEGSDAQRIAQAYGLEPNESA